MKPAIVFIVVRGELVVATYTTLAAANAHIARYSKPEQKAWYVQELDLRDRVPPA